MNGTTRSLENFTEGGNSTESYGTTERSVVTSSPLGSALTTEGPVNVTINTLLSGVTTVQSNISEMVTLNSTGFDFVTYNTTSQMDDTGQQQNNVGVSDLEVKIAYIIIGILGVLGNGISIVVFLSSKNMRNNMTNQFLIHQNFIDLVASVFILTTIPDHGEKVYEGISGLLYCLFWSNAFLVWLILLVSAFNLVALSLERWLKITKPFFHRKHFTKRVAYVMMALAWIMAMIYQISLEASTSDVIDGQCYTQAIWSSDEARKTLGVISFLIKLFFPVLIIILCYAGIIAAIRQSSSIHDQNKHQEKMAKIQRNILKTLVIIVVFFVICITWNQMVFLLHNLEVIQLDFTGWNFHLSIIFYFANCCVNPFIYVAKYEEFRKTLVRMFCKKRLLESGSEASTTTEVIDMSTI